MENRVYILVIILLSLFLAILSVGFASNKSHSDVFTETMKEVASAMSQDHSGIYLVPSDNDLYEWSTILALFRGQSYDSCRVLLSKYNYSLTQMKDARTGNVYDIIREDSPVRRGWGTYIYNRDHAKRLIIHINHPVDDVGVLALGVELFRRSDAEWLLIAGTSKNALFGKTSSDVGRLKRTVFQRWHEILSDLTHVSLSLHGFNEKSYNYPINTTDIIVSNGKTTDDQWGIAQISLAFRDTMRAVGFSCSLAMYDSGLARLAGGWNPQGVFSNDSVGFGHWLYVELSNKIRSQATFHSSLIAGIDRALELSGKKISQQVNRAFGLVSPRVLRVDSLHRLFFPPASAEPYRILSFNSHNERNDSIDLRIGNWLELFGTRKAIASVSRLDTGNIDSHDQLLKSSNRELQSVVSRIVESKKSLLSAIVKLPQNNEQDTSLTDEDDRRGVEPLQVHRIPLQPLLMSTFDHRSIPVTAASFRWEGIISPYFNPHLSAFQISSSEETNVPTNGLPKFLIPLMNNSYLPGKNKFIGVQMTDILVNEIARLVIEYQVEDKDIGLLAEQTERGDYYLRIFPGASREK